MKSTLSWRSGCVAIATLPLCLGLLGASPASGTAATEGCYKASDYRLVKNGMTTKRLVKLLDGQPNNKQTGVYKGDEYRRDLSGWSYAPCTPRDPYRELFAYVKNGEVVGKTYNNPNGY